MKGFTHFISGVAASTFIKSAVAKASFTTGEGSFLLLLGGLFGILPDTLDFKLARFTEDPDFVVSPDPLNPDPDKMIKVVQQALEVCWKEKKPVTVAFRTMRMGFDMWREYEIDLKPDSVRIKIGPIVSTSQVPFPGTDLKKEASIKPPAQLLGTRDKPSTVNIFTGPDFAFIPKENGIEVVFLSWHRQWSHSFTLGALLAAHVAAFAANWTAFSFWKGLLFNLCLGGLSAAFGFLFGKIKKWLGYLAAWLPLIGWALASKLFGIDPFSGLLYGLVSIVGYYVHLLEDLTGFMGGNLFWPFTKGRTKGLELVKASHPLVNLLVVWLAASVILYNLDRFSGTQIITIPWWQFFALFYILPAAAVSLLYLVTPPPAAEAARTEIEEEYSEEISR